VVQVINDPYSGNVFGRLGKGIGQGLNEQVPKEIERSRLSSGLKKLSERAKKEKLSPFDIFAEAAGTPGVTPQHLYTMSPILNQMVQKQNFIDRGGEGGGPSAPGKGKKIGMEGGGALGGEVEAGEGGFASPSQIENYKQNILQEPDFHQVNALAKEYLADGITQDPGEATKLAASQLSQDRAVQQQKIAQFKNDFGGPQGRFALQLQKGPLGHESFKAVAGEIQQGLLDQGEYLMAAKGLTPEQASLEMGNIALELAKTTDKLKKTSTPTNLFTMSREGKSNDLREQKREFEKYGFGEQFNDMAASSMGITPLEAAHVLSPLHNPKTQKLIDDTKIPPAAKRKGFNPFIPTKQEENNIDPSRLDSIIKSISPKDNLFSIEYLLRAKGLDIQQFKKRVAELRDEKVISLSPEQQRQLKRSVTNSFWGDILFETL
jgi:hypothetical protein